MKQHSVCTSGTCEACWEKREARKRLEYLREQIEAENISYGEIEELRTLAEYIEPGDFLLLEWAGVPENEYV